VTKQFHEMQDFITKKMRMSHVYQSVRSIELLKRGGAADVNVIARSLLLYGQSQLQYSEEITKGMVGKVLTKSRGITEKDGNIECKYDIGGSPLECGVDAY
jgi:ATP adenylyltransferase